MNVSQPGDWIFSKFPTTPNARQLETWHNIFWRVAVMWIPPRDERFEFIRDLGSSHLDAVFGNRPIRFPGSAGKGFQALTFIFPERHLTTQEESAFVYCLNNHHQIIQATLTNIDIVTKSPMLIGSFLRDDILIIKDEDSYSGGLSNEYRSAFPNSPRPTG